MKSENVRSVLCAGQWVLRDRRIVAFDEAELLADARRCAADIRRRAGLV